MAGSLQVGKEEEEMAWSEGMDKSSTERVSGATDDVMEGERERQISRCRRSRCARMRQ